MLADKLNKLGVVPDICLSIDGKPIDQDSQSITEVACYNQYPFEDTKVYVIDGAGNEAVWRDGQWCDRQ